MHPYVHFHAKSWWEDVYYDKPIHEFPSIAPKTSF